MTECELLYTSEAAEFLRRPVNTLRHWRKTGHGPRCYKEEGRIIYFRSELLQWLRSNPITTPSVTATIERIGREL